MTGLEKILKHIEEDAVAAAQIVITDAQKKAEEIMAEAKAESDKLRADMAEQTKASVQASVSRSKSAALLQEKKLILNAKQQIINDVIEKAKVSLVNLSDQEYFDFILNMVKKYVKDQQGQILFSERDKKRMPKDFEATIGAQISNRNGAVLTVSSKTRNFDGGFILIYGDIEENCSFDALFFAARESLQDKVCELLFG